MCMFKRVYLVYLILKKNHYTVKQLTNYVLTFLSDIKINYYLFYVGGICVFMGLGTSKMCSPLPNNLVALLQVNVKGNHRP